MQTFQCVMTFRQFGGELARLHAKYTSYSITYCAPAKQQSMVLFLSACVCACNRAVSEQDTHQEMRYPNVTSLYSATPVAFNVPPAEGFLWELDDHRKILHRGQKMAKVQNSEEIFPKIPTT